MFSLVKLEKKLYFYYDSFFFQSRPITTGDTVSDYEIIHEFDAPLQCEEEFYTKHNVG